MVRTEHLSWQSRGKEDNQQVVSYFAAFMIEGSPTHIVTVVLCAALLVSEEASACLALCPVPHIPITVELDLPLWPPASRAVVVKFEVPLVFLPQVSRAEVYYVWAR